MMKAFKRYKYGDPEVLQLEDVDLPVPNKNQVLVKVHSLSINPAEWHILRGKIWIIRLAHGLFKPKHQILGGDVAGEVVDTGDKVAGFKVGDRVFGRAEHSALGEYALLDSSKCAIIPSNLAYTEASSLPLAAITALDSLDQGKGMSKGSKVLINGASGGIGTLAVQIAKSRGAIVHGISSKKNHHLVTELGADQVFDYHQNNFMDQLAQYDRVIDLVGNLDLSKSATLVKEKGVFVMVGYSGFKEMFSFITRSIFIKSIKLVTVNAETTTDKLTTIGVLVTSGKVKPVIDQIYDFESTRKAFTYLGSRRAKGKIVITIDSRK